MARPRLDDEERRNDRLVQGLTYTALTQVH